MAQPGALGGNKLSAAAQRAFDKLMAALPANKRMQAESIRARLHFDPAGWRRLAEEDLSMIGLRFYDDPFVPDARFDTLKREFGDRFEAIELDPKDAAPGPLKHPHSVLTLNLADDGPTKGAEQRVIQFFRDRTGAA